MISAVLPGADIGRSIRKRKSSLPHPNPKIKGPYIPGAIRSRDRSRSMGEAIAVGPHIATAIWELKRTLSLPRNSDEKYPNIGVSVFQRPSALPIGPSLQSLTVVRTPPERQCHVFCKRERHQSECQSQNKIDPMIFHTTILFLLKRV